MRSDRQAQVAGERVAGLPADELGVEPAGLGEVHDGVAVDRAHVDVDARRQPHDGEAHAPVDERDVEVERPLVPGSTDPRTLPTSRSRSWRNVTSAAPPRRSSRGHDDGDEHAGHEPLRLERRFPRLGGGDF